MTGNETTLSFVPLLPWPLIAALALSAFVVLAFGLWRRARGMVWRALAVTIILLTLVNPTFVIENRNYLPSVVVAVLDESASQTIGQRARDYPGVVRSLTGRCGN